MFQIFIFDDACFNCFHKLFKCFSSNKFAKHWNNVILLTFSTKFGECFSLSSLLWLKIVNNFHETSPRNYTIFKIRSSAKKKIHKRIYGKKWSCTMHIGCKSEREKPFFFVLTSLTIVATCYSILGFAHLKICIIQNRQNLQDSTKINRPEHNMRMYWTNFRQPTAHVQQDIFGKTLI